MAALDRVDSLSRAEADAQILLRQMHLDGAVGDERHVAGIAVIGDAGGPLQRRLRLQLEHVAVELVHGGHVGGELFT